MSPPATGVARLLRDARAAVRDARARSRLARAWQLLHQRDADGNLANPVPWTDAALGELHAAVEHDPDDVRAMHHLAIAQHARAWDLELQGRPEAVAAWTEALGCWRIVSASAPFWASLERKLHACDPQADVAVVAELRRDLLEHLLDIHVDFVRHYCESGEPERATAHVQIIHAARIPPALRKRLTGKVFAAMTASVPEAKAQGAFVPALTTVERFLTLFPQHLPALRLQAELCTACVSGLSYRDDWEAIEDVSERARPFAQKIEEHPDLAAEPLAVAALVELAGELCQRGYDRTDAYLDKREYADLGMTERAQLSAGLDLAIRWGRLAHRLSPSDSRLRELFTICLLNRAYFLHQEAREVATADIDHLTRVATRARLYRQAVAETEEAWALSPGQDKLEKNLAIFRAALERCESELALLKIQKALG
jgi:hypothetical protein